MTCAVALGLLGAICAPAAEVDASGTSGPWQLRSSAPAVLDSASSITCTSQTHCIAVGGDAWSTGVALVSDDAGATWTSATLPASTPALTDVACPAATECFATADPGVTNYLLGGGNVIYGAVLLVSTDGGSTWTQVLNSADVNSAALDGVQCADANDCVVEGYSSLTNAQASGTVLHTSDGGSSWADISPFDASLAGVTPDAAVCQTDADCIVSGTDGNGGIYVEHTSNTGLTWQPGTIPNSVQYVGDIECPSATTCFATANLAAGAAVIESTDAGATWSLVSAALANDLAGLACTDTSHCFAFGGNQNPGSLALDQGVLVTTSDGGSSWTRLSAPGSSAAFLSMSCTSSTSCLALGFARTGVQVLYGYSGSSSVSVLKSPIQTGVSAITDMTCASSTHCVAMGMVVTSSGELQHALTSNDRGRTWSVGARLPLLVTYGLTCPDTARCLAVTEDPTIGSTSFVRSLDGGRSFIEGGSPDGQTISDINCITVTVCVAGGAGLLRTTNGGRTWASQHFSVPRTQGTTSVGCMSVETCIAFVDRTKGSAVPVRTTDGGRHWSTGKVLGIRFFWGTSTTCSSAATCLATGFTETPDGASRAVVLVSRDRGATWRLLSHLAGVTAGYQIGCTSARRCVAVGTTDLFFGSSVVYTSDDAGLRWTRQGMPPQLDSSESVSITKFGTFYTTGQLDGSSDVWALR